MRPISGTSAAVAGRRVVVGMGGSEIYWAKANGRRSPGVVCDVDE
jgi:hypothetical protein